MLLSNIVARWVAKLWGDKWLSWGRWVAKCGKTDG
jgi:hypothetical protein